MLLLTWLLACGEQDDPDPADLCRDEGTADCCSDDECADGSICHFEYTCFTRGGRWECSEPAGTNECHELCTDTGFSCDELEQACQDVQHVQGGSSYEDITACF